MTNAKAQMPNECQISNDQIEQISLDVPPAFAHGSHSRVAGHVLTLRHLDFVIWVSLALIYSEAFEIPNNLKQRMMG